MKLDKNDLVSITFETDGEETIIFRVRNVVASRPPQELNAILTYDRNDMSNRALSQETRERLETVPTDHVGFTVTSELCIRVDLLEEGKSDGELGEIIRFTSGFESGFSCPWFGAGEGTEDGLVGKYLEDFVQQIPESHIDPPSQLTIVKKKHQFNLRRNDKIILKVPDQADIPLYFEKSWRGTRDDVGQHPEGGFLILHDAPMSEPIHPLIFGLILIFPGTRNEQGYYECSVYEKFGTQELDYTHFSSEDCVGPLGTMVNDKMYLKKHNRLVASFKRLALMRVCEKLMLAHDLLEQINNDLEEMEIPEESFLIYEGNHLELDEWKRWSSLAPPPFLFGGPEPEPEPEIVIGATIASQKPPLTKKKRPKTKRKKTKRRKTKRKEKEKKKKKKKERKRKRKTKKK